MTITERASTPVEEEYTISLRDLLRVIWKWLWLVAAVTVLVTGVAIGFSVLQRPEYEASIMILVGQEQQSDASGNLGNDVQGLQQITQTMVEAVGSRPVAAAVIEQLNLEITPEIFLEQRLSVEQVGATQFIQVNYKDQSPERAQQVANTVGDVFSNQVSDVSASTDAITATVWERATTPEDPISPNLMVVIPAALMLGLMLGLGLTFLVEYLDDSWRSPEEVEQVSGVPTFGVIPHFKTSKDGIRKGKKGQD